MRVPGLAVLVGIVALGLGSGAAYFHYQEPRLAAERDAMLASAPTTAEGRVREWHRFGGPQIHHRLTKFARFSTDMPWLVTHAVDLPDTDEVEVWGVDLEPLPLELSRVEGRTVVVELPAPEALGRRRLAPRRADHVPVYPTRAAVPDADERLRSLARYFLGGLPDALVEDIEGAELVIRVARPD